MSTYVSPKCPKTGRNLYSVTSERVWEKIEFFRDKFNPSSLNWKEPFLADQLEPNSLLLRLVKEVEEEYNYGMSEFQCSWAVNQAFHGEDAGVKMMGIYNKKNGTSLRPRE